MKQNTWLIIMAGGVGSRFWPVSTEEKPKQFLDMLGLGRTLFQQTVDRFNGICSPKNILVVTSLKYIDIVKEQCPELPEENILAEPCMRNTAPCIAYACYKIKKKDPQATIVVSPADHLIPETDVFQQTIIEGLEFVESNPAILTLGITPRHPETGYGYIHMTNKNESFTKVKAFKEKPHLETAKSYLVAGDYLWNAGIFLWSNETIISAFEKYNLPIAKAFNDGMSFYYTDKEQDYIDSIYPVCENISIDYCIMEKADNIYVRAVQFQWSDLGTWSALWNKTGKSEQGNYSSSSVSSFYESSDNIVYVDSDKKVVIQGLNDYIIVDANNVLLICKKEEEQRIKEFRNK